MVDQILARNEEFEINARKFLQGDLAAGQRAREASFKAAQLYRDFDKKSSEN